MFIVRRSVLALPGRRDETVKVIKEFNALLDKEFARTTRIVTGSIGASDSLIETETPVESLAVFEQQLQKANSLPGIQAYQSKMGELLVPGSNRFEIFRVQS